MDWLTTVVLGSYAYTTLAFGWMWRVLSAFMSNHYTSLEKRVKALEDMVNGGS